MTTNPGGKSPGKPSFFWQGLLILLPVVALASVGLYALRQDQALARLAATEHAQALAGLIADSVWHSLVTVTGSGGSDPNSFQVDPGGHLLFPRPYPKTPVPQQLSWTALSPEQARLWQTASRAGSLEKPDPTATAMVENWKKFLALSPPVEFAATAHLRLGLELAEQSQLAAAAEQFGIVIEQHPRAIGESGLPLRPLAQMKLLELAATDPTRSRWERMALLHSLCSNAVTYPTAVTPHLLKLAREREAVLDASPSGCREWMETWTRHESARRLYAAAAPHLTQLTPLSARTGATPKSTLPRCFWFSTLEPGADTNRLTQLEQTWLAQRVEADATNVWFICRAFDEDVQGSVPLAQSTPTSPDPGAPRPPSARLKTRHARLNAPSDLRQVGLGFRQRHNDWADVNGLHSPPLRLSRADLLDRSRIKLPDYFDISLEVAGKTILSSNQLPVLVYTTAGKGSGQYWKKTSAAPPPLLAQAGKVEDGAEVLRVGIHLIGPELLYARERDRALWFGALIAASALAAFLGFASAWRAFARQQRLAEMKSNFVSSVSHELRAPIASVRLMAEGLERGTVTEPARQHEYFRFIVQECRRLSALIENVLDFARIEQGRKQYEFEPTDLAALVRETARLLEPNAAEKQLTLTLQIPEAPPPQLSSPPMLDGRAIQQALVNLIDNALKHSPTGATVTIGLDWSPAAPEGAGTPACLQLWVEDCGAGIPAAEHERIFERFYRRGSELRRETQGVGIGLSLVQHIAQAHSGSVTVHSEVGQGSRFTLELPMQQEAEL